LSGRPISDEGIFMLRFIENKKTPVSGGGFFPRQRVAEFTKYQSVSLKDAAAKLAAEAAGKNVQCHFGHTNGAGFMEGRYAVLKIAGGDLRFYDPRNVNNRLSICLRDVTEATVGEDPEVQFVTFRFDLKDRTFVTVTPM
jgi:hypothetical protein